MSRRITDDPTPKIDLDQLRVSDLMTRDVISARVPGDRKTALKLMIQHHLSGLVLVKKGNKELAGVVTRQDIFDKPEEEQLALLMTEDPITVAPDESIVECAELFTELKIHRLPVVDDQGKVVGIITPCDLMTTMEKLDIREPVKNYQNPYCHPVHENTPTVIAIHTMKLNSHYALPVINLDLEVVGIVTDRDVFEKASFDSNIVESYVGLSEEEDAWSWEGFRSIAKMFYNLKKIDLPQGRVSGVMVSKVKSLFEETPVSRAASLMRRYNYDQLPITDVDDKLTGLVTSYGILPALFKE